MQQFGGRAVAASTVSRVGRLVVVAGCHLLLAAPRAQLGYGAWADWGMRVEDGGAGAYTALRDDDR